MAGDLHSGWVGDLDSTLISLMAWLTNSKRRAKIYLLTAHVLQGCRDIICHHLASRTVITDEDMQVCRKAELMALH